MVTDLRLVLPDQLTVVILILSSPPPPRRSIDANDPATGVSLLTFYFTRSGCLAPAHRVLRIKTCLVGLHPEALKQTSSISQNRQNPSGDFFRQLVETLGYELFDMKKRERATAPFLSWRSLPTAMDGLI
jgi:hypothetical protein